MIKSTIKKVAAGALASTLVLASAVPAFAADTDKYINSIGSVAADDAHIGNDGATVHGDADVASKSQGVTGYDDTQNRESEYETVDTTSTDGQTYGGDGFVASTYTHEVKVYATMAEQEDVDATGDGTVVVSVPKVVILGPESSAVDADWSGIYKVKVRGNIAGDTYVKVTPQASFTMSQAGKANNLTVGTVQAEQYFVADETAFLGISGLANTYTAANVLGGVKAQTAFDNTSAATTGKMTVDQTTVKVTAGSWAGTTTFDIQMRSAASA